MPLVSGFAKNEGLWPIGQKQRIGSVGQTKMGTSAFIYL